MCEKIKMNDQFNWHSLLVLHTVAEYAGIGKEIHCIKQSIHSTEWMYV